MRSKWLCLWFRCVSVRLIRQASDDLSRRWIRVSLDIHLNDGIEEDSLLCLTGLDSWTSMIDWPENKEGKTKTERKTFGSSKRRDIFRSGSRSINTHRLSLMALYCLNNVALLMWNNHSASVRGVSRGVRFIWGSLIWSLLFSSAVKQVVSVIKPGS